MSPRPRGDDDVEQTGFVLQVEEGHSSSRPGSLTVGYHPGDLDTSSGLNTIQPVDPYHTPSIKGISYLADRVISRTNTGSAEVVTQ